MSRKKRVSKYRKGREERERRNHRETEEGGCVESLIDSCECGGKKEQNHQVQKSWQRATYDLLKLNQKGRGNGRTFRVRKTAGVNIVSVAFKTGQ